MYFFSWIYYHNRRFRPAFGMCSTQMLVEIYNIWANVLGITCMFSFNQQLLIFDCNSWNSFSESTHFRFPSWLLIFVLFSGSLAFLATILLSPSWLLLLQQKIDASVCEIFEKSIIQSQIQLHDIIWIGTIKLYITWNCMDKIINFFTKPKNFYAMKVFFICMQDKLWWIFA